MSPFQQPAAGGDQFKVSEHQGSLALIFVREFRQGISTSNGPADAVAADIHVLDGPDAGGDYENSLIFGKSLVPSLSGAAGKDPVLGRFGQGVAKPGQSAPWVLQQYSDADAAIATAWLAQHAGAAPVPAAPAPAAPAMPAPAPAAPAAPGLDLASLPPAVLELLKAAGGPNPTAAA